MNIETKDWKAARLAWMSKEGFTMLAEFLPFSKSRNAKEFPRRKDLSINWKVTLEHPRGSFTTDYMQGVGHLPVVKEKMSSDSFEMLQRYIFACETGYMWRSGKGVFIEKGERLIPPTFEDVFFCLLWEGEAALQSFDEWCSNFGYDTDSRKAERLYQECQKTGYYLLKTIGPEGMKKAQELWQDF